VGNKTIALQSDAQRTELHCRKFHHVFLSIYFDGSRPSKKHLIALKKKARHDANELASPQFKFFEPRFDGRSETSNGAETKSSLMFVTSISNALLLVWRLQLAKSVRAIAARVAFLE
jgi:hypothetical protein